MDFALIKLVLVAAFLLFGGMALREEWQSWAK